MVVWQGLQGGLEARYRFGNELLGALVLLTDLVGSRPMAAS
ncbi:hypothetical protein ACFYUV_51085 [Nonomuraea sp. NPDC003560]